jgi:hypothetical protein
MKKLLMIALIIPFLFSCKDKDKEKEGCTDIFALNYDADAEKDDGSCEYCKITFYCKSDSYFGLTITSVDISVNGIIIGSATTAYPDGPGNCNAEGTVIYEFHNNEPVVWNSEVHLSDGSALYDSGTVSPDNSDCIEVKVTN